MLKYDTIVARYQKATEKIEKKSATIERKRKTIANKMKMISSGKGDAEDLQYDIDTLQRDIERLLNEVDEARVAASEWKQLLDEADAKRKSRNCKPILDFLEEWKGRVTEYYLHLAEVWQEEGKALSAEKKEALKDKWDLPFKERRALEDLWYRKENDFDRRYSCIRRYMPYYCSRFDDALLQKDLEAEAEGRYDELIEKVSKITGEITDASNLDIGPKGDLEGYITGRNGVAEVFTIGAGGYNVQCYHYRVLVKRRG